MDRSRRYDQSEDYFGLRGHAVMALTRAAAIGVCLEAADRGVLIVRVEGGIWHGPGFEARGDSIWDGADPPIDLLSAISNNGRAARFIRDEPTAHDVFIITEAPLSGYRHKQQ